MAFAETAGRVAAPAPRPWWRGRLGLVLLVAAGMAIAFAGWRNDLVWPASLTWNALAHHLDNFQTWLSNNRNVPHPSVFFRVFNGIATFLDDIVGWLASLFFKLTWVGTTALGVLVVLRFGGRRAALGTLAAFLSFAAMGLWDPSMRTFALTFASVALSLVIGLPLGVLAGRSDGFRRVITPVLDAMQIVPAFAYLMPIVLLFSVGPGAAVVTTLIYSVPPAIRITALGIRSVPTNTVEAAAALGATRLQTLFKVQLPLARRLLLLSVNQTILFALSMVVIAGLIGGEGLGDVVTSGLNSYPALAFLAGIVIVVMAMALDRVTEAVAERTDPARRHLTEKLRRRLRLATFATAAAIVAVVAVARLLGASAVYPRWTANDWLLAQIQAAIDYMQDPTTVLFRVTSWVGDHIVEYGLVPFRNFLVETPWFVTVAAVTAIALVVSGRRAAVTALAMLLTIGVIGQWEQSMETASQVLVATLLAVAVGFALGIWAAVSRAFSRLLRPVNDVLQTLPQLVYLIPLVYLMPVSIVPGVIAGVLYAFPVVSRLVESGVRTVEANTVEAAGAFGATRRQVLLKVKIPLAQDAIMLGVNQGIIMVLAVVVIGGLVGSPGLGYEVAQGLGRADFGLGVLASLAILALGITLDRVTRGARRTQQAGRT